MEIIIATVERNLNTLRYPSGTEVFISAVRLCRILYFQIWSLDPCGELDQDAVRAAPPPPVGWGCQAPDRGFYTPRCYFIPRLHSDHIM